MSNQVSQSVSQSVTKKCLQIGSKFFSGKIIAFLVAKKILNIIWALQRDLDEKIVFQPPAEIPFRAFLKDFPRAFWWKIFKNLKRPGWLILTFWNNSEVF